MKKRVVTIKLYFEGEHVTGEEIKNQLLASIESGELVIDKIRTIQESEEGLS